MLALERTILIASLAIFAVSCTGVRATDAELDALTPEGVLNLYWYASLKGDSETVARLAGSSRTAMIWECPPTDTRQESTPKGFIFQTPESTNETTDPTNRKPSDGVDLILTWSRVIQISRKPIAQYYEIAERKVFNNEARILLRQKETPNQYNSMVYFMFHDGARWRLIDIRPEAHLGMVGNQKYAEPRDCPATR